MRNLIISILMWLSFIGCSDKDGLLSPAEMKEDIRFYFHMIRDIHPDPYQRYDSLTFVRLEAEMIESCSEPMAREDFGFRLMKTRKFLETITNSTTNSYSHFGFSKAGPTES